MSSVTRPARVVPKSSVITGFLKSMFAFFAAPFNPAVTSSPSISFATTLAFAGGRLLAIAPSKYTFFNHVNSLRLGGRDSGDNEAVIFLGGTPACRQPSARALTISPTSSGFANPAVTPVDRTTKCRSFSMLIPTESKTDVNVSATSSVTDSRVSLVPTSVSPKTSSPGAGGRTSLVKRTSLVISKRSAVLRLVVSSTHLVVVFPSSTDATV